MVSAVAGFVKVRYLIDKATIDNIVFRAHYRITSAILFLSCIIVTANNLIGKFDPRILKFNSRNFYVKLQSAECVCVRERENVDHCKLCIKQK